MNDAVTYYPSDGDFSEPTSLSQKTASDRLFDDSLAAYNQGHPGAYYTTVMGGEPGNMFTGEIMVSPPNSVGSIKSLMSLYNLLQDTGISSGAEGPDWVFSKYSLMFSTKR